MNCINAANISLNIGHHQCNESMRLNIRASYIAIGKFITCGT